MHFAQASSDVPKWNRCLLYAIASLLATAAMLAMLPSEGHALPSSARNGAVTHNLQFVATVNNAAKPIRDARGQPRVGVGGTLLHGAPRANCLGAAGQTKICARVQGLEAVSTTGSGNLYYVWPGETQQFGEQGFVARSDLKTTPSVTAPPAPIGAALGAAPGAPSFRVNVTPIDNSQGYVGVGDGLAHTFAAYGQASAYGGDYALMTWNWTNVVGGGIARAAVAGGETFYPSDIDPITLNTYPVTLGANGYTGGTGAPNGSVTVRYGRVNNGSRDLYGWMVVRHIAPNGTCVDHMQLTSGVDVAGSLCPTPAIFHTSNTVPVGGAAAPVNASGYFGTTGDLAITGDWDGDGEDTVGVFRPSQGIFYTSNTLPAGGAGAPVTTGGYFGTAGDLPFAGDWDGDGKDTIGVFRPSQGIFYTSNTVPVGGAAAPVTTGGYFGTAGDLPIIGDWDGDGKDTIGVFRPSQGIFYTSNTVPVGGAAAPVTTGGYFGTAGDLPVIGDWDGDSKDSIGIFRPQQGIFHMSNTVPVGGAAAPVTASGYFGQAGDQPVAGDWTDVGRDAIGVFRAP